MSPVHSKPRIYRQESKKRKLTVTQPKLDNVFIMDEGPGIETHPTGGARSCSHGAKFEREMAMLWTYRAHRTGREYTVAIEDERTGKFDDYYIRIKLEDGTFLQQFVQLKHSSQVSGLTFRELFPKQKYGKSTKNVFDLKLYFKSFVDIKNCPDFNTKEKPKEMFIIFTNKILQFGGGKGNFEFCESIFEKVRDSEILNTDLWKFKDEFAGRESLQNLLSENLSDQKYTDQFLKNFYIADSQPDKPAVTELIKSELSHDFEGIHCENAFNRYYTNFLDWYNAIDGNKGTRLSHSLIYDYFARIKDHVVELTSFELMDPTPNFYGRETIITRIRNNLVALNKPSSHVIDVSISGMSGVGKTEIARYYAKEYRSEYDYIIWLNASSLKSLEASFQSLNLFLNISDNNDVSHNNGIASRHEKAISRDKINRIYSFLEPYKCLFIFDNEVDLLKQELINETRKYLPLTKSINHHVIVTTIHRHLLCNYEEHVVNFSKHETLGFLKQNLDSNLYNTDTELNTLGFILSNVTLALQIATSYIKEQHRKYQFLGKSFSVNDFLNFYRERSESILDFKSDSLAHKPLITTCEMSIQSIVNSKESKRCLALKILYIIAYLQPDYIPTKMFVSKEISDEDLMDAISILEIRSLITVSPGYIHIHRLTQDILRAKLQKNSNEMRKMKVRKCSDDNLYFVNKKGQILFSFTKKVIKNGKYTKDYILLAGLDIFDSSFENFKYTKDIEQLMTRNVIVRHTLTFILHCKNKNYITRVHFEFILSTIKCVNDHGMYLECIDYLKNLANNLKYLTSLLDNIFVNFLIKFVITEKCCQVGDFYQGLEAATECQNIIEKHEIPFTYILIHSLMKIYLLKNVGKNEESFNTLMNLYIIFDEHTNLQNENLLHSTVTDAAMLGQLLREHSQFYEATKVCETLQKQASSMCRNNLVPNKENCQCVDSALVLSDIYGLQKKYSEAKEVLLSAQKCAKISSNDENEIKRFSVFFSILCHIYYHCGEKSKALRVLDQASKTQLPKTLGVSIIDNIYFRIYFRHQTAIYLEHYNENEQALDVLREELYNILVIIKSHNILHFNANIKFGINNAPVTNIAITHSKAHPFKLLLFHAIRLAYSHSGFEIAHADLLKIEKSVLLNFGETNELYSYILMCKLSLYHREKKFECKMQIYVKLLQVLYLLSKDSSSFFFVFRMTLTQLLNSKQHLDQDIDLDISKSLLAIVNDAIWSAETSLLRENQACAFSLKLLYFDCLIITKKFDCAKKYGFELLSLTVSNSTSNVFNTMNMIEIYMKLANHLHKNNQESFEAIKLLNQCIHKAKNLVCRGSGCFFSFQDEFNPLQLSVTLINEQYIDEFRIIQRVKCCIEKSKIYFEIGESSKGMNMLQDCMYKTHDFGVRNAAFIPLIKEILLLLLRVGETEEAIKYIKDKCKLDQSTLDPSGACCLLRMKAKLQFKNGHNEDAIKTLLKLWNKKLLLIYRKEIYSYQNIDYVNKIQYMLLELEHQKSISFLDFVMEDNDFQLIAEQKKVYLELLFYIAFCNYLLENYTECIGDLTSLETLLKSDLRMKNEEIDDIIFDVSTLLKCCQNFLNHI